MKQKSIFWLIASSLISLFFLCMSYIYERPFYADNKVEQIVFINESNGRSVLDKLVDDYFSSVNESIKIFARDIHNSLEFQRIIAKLEDLNKKGIKIEVFSNSIKEISIATVYKVAFNITNDFIIMDDSTVYIPGSPFLDFKDQVGIMFVNCQAIAKDVGAFLKLYVQFPSLQLPLKNKVWSNELLVSNNIFNPILLGENESVSFSQSNSLIPPVRDSVAASIKSIVNKNNKKLYISSRSFCQSNAKIPYFIIQNATLSASSIGCDVRVLIDESDDSFSCSLKWASTIASWKNVNIRVYRTNGHSINNFILSDSTLMMGSNSFNASLFAGSFGLNMLYHAANLNEYYSEFLSKWEVSSPFKDYSHILWP